jgi:dihydroorotase
MKISIHHAHVIDPSQSIDQVMDLAIDNGKIAYIGSIPSHFQPDKIIDATNLWVMPGLIDVTCRPQMQHPQGKTLYQEAKAALQCGFTALCIPPDGDPIMDTTANVLRVLKQSDDDLPKLYPIGALTTHLKGDFIADLTALKEAGCIAFSQAQASIDNLRMLRHCYDFAASFSLPVIIQPCVTALSNDGIAHEGQMASQLGLPGIPEIAETIAIAEHLLLIEDSGINAHFTGISSARGMKQILDAKANGLPVTADTAMHSLHLTEAALIAFNSNCHVYPPLRTEKDKISLIQGIQSGELDIICSDHRPLDSISKLAPFGDTVPGLSAIDTLIPLGLKLIRENAISRLNFVQAVSTQPAKVFQLPGGTLKPGSTADLCIVDPHCVWEVTESNIKSRGKNTPFINHQMQGEVVMTFLDGRLVYEAKAS